MNDNLKEETQKKLINVVSHEIRNPLAAIKNGVYYIGYAVKSDNPRVKMTLDIINKEIESIQKMLEDLLAYSKQRPPSLSLVDVNSLIDEVVSIINLPEKVNIVRELEKSLPEFVLDREEIRQVLISIINNAWQACDKEEGIVNIITSLENGNLKLIVIDNGVGIPEDKLDKVFESFYSTKEGAVGLGLTAAKNLINRHEGKINCFSINGEGTEVTILIPQIKNEE